MTEVGGHIHELDVWAAVELHFGRLKQAVVVLADEPRIIYRLTCNFRYVGFDADDAAIIGTGRPVVKGYVLTYA